MNNAVKKETWLKALLVICLLFLSVKFVSVALTNPLSFDGGLYAQEAQNLVRHGLYATSYDGPTVFDPIITTGPAVVLPTALLFLLFGVSTEAALMVNAIFLILLACAIAYLLVYCLKQAALFTVLTLLLLLATPGLFDYGFGLYSEGPMTFYLVMVAIFLHRFGENAQRKSLRLAGLFLGLAFLSKEMAIISAPAILLALVCVVWRDEQQKESLWEKAKQVLSGVGHLLAGFLIPIASFALYKLLSLGWQPYIQSLQAHWSHIIHHEGVRGTSLGVLDIISKLDSHLDELSWYLGLNCIVILLTLLILLVAFILLVFIPFARKEKWQNLRSNPVLRSAAVLFLFTLVLSLLGWWLLLSGLAWTRYIFPGIILLEICLVLLLDVGLRAVAALGHDEHKWVTILSRGALAVFVLLLISYGIFQLDRTKNYRISFADKPEKVASQHAGDFVAQLPADARIYGYGWWQAPLISFTADRQFNNIFTAPKLYIPGPLHEVYFVYDFSSYYYDPGGGQEIVDQFESRPVYTDEEYKVFIYQLTARPFFAYPEFNAEEKAAVAYSRIDFTEDDPAVKTRNVYVNEHNPYGKWAQRNSAYLLKYSGEKRLRIELGFQPAEVYETMPITLDVYVNRELVGTYQFSEGGTQELDIVLDGLMKDTVEVTLITDAQIYSDIDGRMLSFFIESMELVD